MEPLLEVKGLNLDIRTPEGVLRPVRDLDLRVARGETLAIVGESGCGKSLTSLAIMGLLPKNARLRAEAITLAGSSLLGLSGSQWRRIRGARMAMIFQDPMTALDPCYRIGDQMVEVMRQHRRVSRRAALEHAEAMLDRVGIPSARQRLKAFPHQLSGGLRQRVLIAMALLCEPELVIADEPTTALDVTVQAQILRLLADLQQELRMGLIIISHDLGVVSGVADRVAVMYGGQIVETGDCAEVFQQPLHPYTEGLIRSIPVPGETDRSRPLGTVPGVVPRPFGELRQCGFTGRCPYVRPECRERPIELRTVGADRAYRCVLPAEASARDTTAWARLDDLSLS